MCKTNNKCTARMMRDKNRSPHSLLLGVVVVVICPFVVARGYYKRWWGKYCSKRRTTGAAHTVPTTVHLRLMMMRNYSLGTRIGQQPPRTRYSLEKQTVRQAEALDFAPTWKLSTYCHHQKQQQQLNHDQSESEFTQPVSNRSAQKRRTMGNQKTALKKSQFSQKVIRERELQPQRMHSFMKYQPAHGMVIKMMIYSYYLHCG